MWSSAPSCTNRFPRYSNTTTSASPSTSETGTDLWYGFPTRFQPFTSVTAAGSASETRSALQVAVAWGYLPNAECGTADQLLDRILAILWRLTHG